MRKETGTEVESGWIYRIKIEIMDRMIGKSMPDMACFCVIGKFFENEKRIHAGVEI